MNTPTSHRFERAAAVVLTVIVVAAVLRIRTISDAQIDELPVLAWFVAAVAAGPLLQVRLPGGLTLSPIGSAMALGITLTPWTLRRLLTAPGWATLTIVIVVGLAVGHLIRWAWTRELPRLVPILATVVGAFASAYIYRDLPLFRGNSALEKWPEWGDERWRSAVMMLLATAIGAGIESAITGLSWWHDERRHVAWRRVLGILAALMAAVICTATMIGIGTSPLGLLAVPVMAAPLVLVRIALEQQRRARTERRASVATVGRFTDISEFTTDGHGVRVRDLSRRVARELHCTEDDLAALDEACLLHDLGQVSLRVPIPAGATVEAAPVDQHDIAALGSSITEVGGSEPLVVSFVAHQAVPYRQVREFGEEVPLASRVLKVCNAYDDFTGGRAEAGSAAVERLSLGLGYEYDPEVMVALLRVLETEGPELPRADD